MYVVCLHVMLLHTYQTTVPCNDGLYAPGRPDKLLDQLRLRGLEWDPQYLEGVPVCVHVYDLYTYSCNTKST